MTNPPLEDKVYRIELMRASGKALTHLTQRGGYIAHYRNDLLRESDKGDKDSAQILGVIAAFDEFISGKMGEGGMVQFFAQGGTVDEIAQRHVKYMDEIDKNAQVLATRMDSHSLAHIIPLIAREFEKFIDGEIPGLKEKKAALRAGRPKE